MAKGKIREQKGITLGVLALTIVIIIILATVTINLVFGDNGLINQAQTAKEMAEVSSIKEKMEMVKADTYIEGQGKIDPDDFFEKLEQEGIIGDKDTDVVDNGDGSYEVTVEPDYVFEVTLKPSKDDANDAEIDYVGKGENQGPRIKEIKVVSQTENSVSIEVTARNAEGGTYTYSYKKEGEPSWIDVASNNSNTYEYTNLEENTTYDIKVKVETSEGTSEKEIKVTIGKTAEVPEGTITFGEAEWSGYRASVTVSTSAEDYTIEYQVNGTEDRQWRTVDNGGTVEDLYNGDKVYARITDGEQASSPQEKQILDTKAPAQANIELNKTELTAGESLTAKVTHIDNESGAEISQSKWIMNTSAGAIGTDAGSYTGTFSSNGETITLESSATGEYYLHVLTVDKAGNKTETISNKITIGNITGTVKQKGKTTWSEGKASIELEATEAQYTIEYKINSGSWTNYSGTIGNLNHGDKVTARLTNGTVTGPETTIEIKDENDPVVIVTAGGTTTNSVTVSVSASDNESGMLDNVTYTYYIKKTGEGDASYSSPSGASNISQTNYTFTNLDQGTSYDVKVEAKADKAGNIGTGNLLSQTTATIGGASEGLEEGNIVAGPVTWKNEKASTTLTTSTNLQIQYQINNTIEGSWKTISNGGTVGNLNHGDTVFARLYDGTNHGDEASVNILDGISPAVSVSTGTVTYNSITVNVVASDGQSGLATSNTYKYYLNGALKDTLTTNSYTFTGLTAETQYTIKVEAYDKANNKGTDTITATTKKQTVSDAIDNGTQFEDTTSIVDDSGDEVWIPGGFEIADDSATDADDGIVIQDSKGNQFVWIPVPDYTTMYGTGTYTLCGVSTQTSVYSKLRQRSGDRYTVTTPGSTSQIREPDLVTNYDTKSSYYSILASSAKAMADDMVAEYTATYNSIKKYKGFYIGRYELTGTVSSPTVKKGQTVLSADIAGNWYYLKKACTNIVSSSYAQSTMVYGNQWDEIMSWLVSSGGKTSSEVNTNSSSWGNYSNSTGAAATNSGSKQTSGKNEAWKANNIYDLAGNCREWTQEANDTLSRILRGR